MPKYSNAKILLNIDQKQFDRDMENIETSVLAAVAKINHKLKLEPIKIKLDTQDKGTTYSASLYQMISNDFDNLWYTLEDTRANTERSTNNRYTSTPQAQPRSTSGTTLPVPIVAEGNAEPKGKLDKVKVAMGKAAGFLNGLDVKAQSLISTFNDFDNAISALASKTMSFADMLDLAHNNVGVGYFAKMLNQNTPDVFHAINTGRGFTLNPQESMRQLQQMADVNTQLASDPQHVKFKEILDALSKIDPRILQVNNQNGKAFTALERWQMIADANSKLYQTRPDLAAANARVIGHNNEWAAALYIDNPKFHRYFDEKADQPWIDPVTGITKQVTRSVYQSLLLGKSDAIDSQNNDNIITKNDLQGQGLNQASGQILGILEQNSATMHDLGQRGFFGKTAIQDGLNDRYKMGALLYQAKGTMLGWGGYNGLLSSLYPLINPATGERVVQPEDVDPAIVKAIQTGYYDMHNNSLLFGTGMMPSNSSLNRSKDFYKDVTDEQIEEAKKNIRAQRIDEAKKNGLSFGEAQSQINDKAIDQAIQSPAIQAEIKRRVAILMRGYQLGGESQLKDLGKDVVLGGQVAAAAGLTFLDPPSLALTGPLVGAQLANRYMTPRQTRIPPGLAAEFGKGLYQELPYAALLNQNRMDIYANLNKRQPSSYKMVDSQAQKITRDVTMNDQRTYSPTINIHANTNDAHAIGNIVQEKMRSLVMKKSEKPAGFPDLFFTNYGAKGQF